MSTRISENSLPLLESAQGAKAALTQPLWGVLYSFYGSLLKGEARGRFR